MRLSLPGQILFATGNPGKAREVAAILGCPVEARKLEIREIQSTSFEEVARAKAAAGAQLAGGWVLVEDSGLSLAAWNGYPGPLTRWAVEAAGERGFARMLDGFADRRAEAVSVFALAGPGMPESSVLVAEGRVPGTIATEPRGTNGFGWDVIFIPEGEDRTFAEMPSLEKNSRSHRRRALDRFCELTGL